MRANFDRWVTDKRVLGLSGYLEGGVQSVDDRRAPVLVPSIGLQLGSLFNINYWDMPAWLRVPVQFLLPLKFRMGVVLSSRDRPRWFSGIEMDVVL